VPENNSLQKVLRRSERVDETRIGDRVVLYQRDTGTGVVLNPSGSRIWDSLSTPSTRSDLVERLANEHGSVPRERIVSDVDTYVAALQQQRLVEGQA